LIRVPRAFVRKITGGNAMSLPLPYKISTLLYAFDDQDRVLLLERLREPNRGLWSPPGGKLETALGESPHACACREAGEELGLELAASDVRLVGMVSECGYEGTAHWLMFLFEIRPRLRGLPPPIEEGRFAFFRREELDALPVPSTDCEQIWPLFWKHRGGFFAAHCHCHPDGTHTWTLDQSST
jgi:8-oxo-dGTP diphosphatase